MLGIDLIDYKGCLILAAPRKREGGGWTLNVRICGTDTTPSQKYEWTGYTGKETFDNQEDAILQSLALGKQIVDGQVPGCSVS